MKSNAITVQPQSIFSEKIAEWKQQLKERKALNVSETQEHNKGIFYFALKHTKNNKPELDVCLSVNRCICAEKKNQLDVTECFIALMICSVCFGHFSAHHQELETVCVTTAFGVQCLVAGCRRSGAGQQAMRSGRGMLHDAVVQHPSSWTHTLLPCTWPREPATKHCTPQAAIAYI